MMIILLSSSLAIKYAFSKGCLDFCYRTDYFVVFVVI